MNEKWMVIRRMGIVLAAGLAAGMLSFLFFSRLEHLELQLLRESEGGTLFFSIFVGALGAVLAILLMYLWSPDWAHLKSDSE